DAIATFDGGTKAARIQQIARDELEAFVPRQIAAMLGPTHHRPYVFAALQEPSHQIRSEMPARPGDQHRPFGLLHAAPTLPYLTRPLELPGDAGVSSATRRSVLRPRPQRPRSETRPSVATRFKDDRRNFAVARPSPLPRYGSRREERNDAPIVAMPKRTWSHMAWLQGSTSRCDRCRMHRKCSSTPDDPWQSLLGRTEQTSNIRRHAPAFMGSSPAKRSSHAQCWAFFDDRRFIRAHAFCTRWLGHSSATMGSGRGQSE